MIADLVPDALRGTAYGTYNAILGILDFPASLIAGVLWEGAFGWKGFGAPAPFLFGAILAFTGCGVDGGLEPEISKTGKMSGRTHAHPSCFRV